MHLLTLLKNVPDYYSYIGRARNKNNWQLSGRALHNIKLMTFHIPLHKYDKILAADLYGDLQICRSYFIYYLYNVAS